MMPKDRRVRGWPRCKRCLSRFKRATGEPVTICPECARDEGIDTRNFDDKATLGFTDDDGGPRDYED
jgi:hypothetical protein